MRDIAMGWSINLLISDAPGILSIVSGAQIFPDGDAISRPVSRVQITGLIRMSSKHDRQWVQIDPAWNALSA
jgi:hypothetical protein